MSTRVLLWMLVSARSAWSRPSCIDLYDSASVEKVAVEIRAGCDVNVASEGGSPLFLACFNGHLAVAKLLLESGANVNQVQNDGVSASMSPLFIACANRHPATARLLIEHGASVNQASHIGTPLSAACQIGHLGLARLLLESGADPHQVGSNGHTPAAMARAKGHKAIIQLIAASRNTPQKKSWVPQFAALLAPVVAMVAAYAWWGARVGAEARAEAARREMEAAEQERQSDARRGCRATTRRRDHTRINTITTTDASNTRRARAPRRRDHNPIITTTTVASPPPPPPPPAATTYFAEASEPLPRERPSTRASRALADDDDDDVTNDALSQTNDECDKAKDGPASPLPAESPSPDDDENDGRRYSHVAAVLASLGLSDEIMLLFRTHEIDDGCLGFVDTADLESIGLPLGTALRVVSASRARANASNNSSKNFVEDLLDDAAVHQSVLEIKLRDHRAELARLKTALQARGGEIEEDLVCPITYELIHEPVVAADGNTYERAAIEAWFETGKATSPMTNAPLASLALTPNNTVRRLISTILEECREFDQLHRTRGRS